MNTLTKFAHEDQGSISATDLVDHSFKTIYTVIAEFQGHNWITEEELLRLKKILSQTRRYRREGMCSAFLIVMLGDVFNVLCRIETEYNPPIPR